MPNNVIEQVLGTDIRKDVFNTADPGPITAAAMHDLVSWYNPLIGNYPWCLAVVSEFVFRFLAIHPFQDGNGRLGRGLWLLGILQSSDDNLKTIAPYIAVDRHIEQHKEEYYLVLRQCSKGRFEQDPRKYQLQFFLRFMLKMMKEALTHDIVYYSNRYQAFAQLADAPRKILVVLGIIQNTN
jgi:hypothetical protein